MSSFEFGPSKETRAFDGRLLEGVETELFLDPVADDGSQGVRLEKWIGNIRHLWGRVPRQIGPAQTVVKRAIRSVVLMVAKNGGRGDSRTWPSYAEYFNDERKRQIQARLRGGLMAKILTAGGGDPEHCDVVVTFDDFALETTLWDMRYPGEWYSELFVGDHRFAFVDGFYPNAEVAVARWREKPTDDMFGERYFPVIVFPIATDMKAIDDVIWRPKATSSPIVRDGQVIFGTRCKPHEFEEVIRMTYAAGGRVPIGIEYDW